MLLTLRNRIVPSPAVVILVGLLLVAQPGFAISIGGLGGPWGAWRTETANQDVSGFTRPTGLALDSFGNPHAVFGDRKPGLGQVYPAYASRSGITWSAPIPLDYTGQYPKIAIDDADGVHVMWLNVSAKYARIEGTTVTTEIIDSYAPGLQSGLVLDSSGNPHVSYHKGTGVGYATRSSITGQWTAEVVEAGGVPIGAWNAVAVDSNDRPHLIYRTGSLALTYAAKGADGVWVKELVDSQCGAYISLALDNNDKPHLSCFQPSVGLRYMNKVGATWSRQTVDAQSSLNLQPGAYGTSIKVDSTGKPHISYATNSNVGDPDMPAQRGYLHYATILPTGAWSIEAVDNVGNSNGLGSALALDANDRPHILYRMEYVYDVLDEVDGVPNGADIKYAEPLLATVLGATGN